MKEFDGGNTEKTSRNCPDRWVCWEWLTMEGHAAIFSMALSNPVISRGGLYLFYLDIETYKT